MNAFWTKHKHIFGRGWGCKLTTRTLESYISAKAKVLDVCFDDLPERTARAASSAHAHRSNSSRCSDILMSTQLLWSSASGEGSPTVPLLQLPSPPTIRRVNCSMALIVATASTETVCERAAHRKLKRKLRRNFSIWLSVAVSPPVRVWSRHYGNHFTHQERISQ